MKLHTRQLTCAAIVGAAYAVLSIFGSIFGITYGPIQCRFSEALCVLPFLLPETAWGLGVGCLIANLLSPYGVLDIVVGSAATLLAALLTARCKKKWLGCRRCWPIWCWWVWCWPTSRPVPPQASGPPTPSTP